MKNIFFPQDRTMWVALFCVGVCCVFLPSALAGFDPELNEQIKPLSPEESLATMEVLDGYRMDLVAAEPLVEEPVLFEFDANGNMYVAEMLTYMQDAEGTGNLDPVSRIKRLQDSDGDGVMDSFTIFADGLLLPRMILSLEEGRLLVRETNTRDVLLIEDLDGDGVSDRRTVVFKGGKRGGNLEHQPSGLIWGIDNWLYVTYTDVRYRWDGTQLISEEMPWGGGQWGIAQDEVGRLCFSVAGAENPALGFQYPIEYGKITIEGEQAEGFREVFPLDKTPDVQGGKKRLHEDGSLNKFTGVAGPSIYVGNTLGKDFVGDLILPEPVGNLVRRAKVVRESGYSIVSNPYQEERTEFIRSTDANFRPIWSGTAPDGDLMLVDMYRGIIQESNWTQEGSYLRGVIDEYGFDRNIGRGRIYRVSKKGASKKRIPLMYEQSTAQLVKYLKSSNGWWRINAQKQIVLRQDKSAIPLLKKVLKNAGKPLARLHALWTLDGLGAADETVLRVAFRDGNADVVSAAVRISQGQLDAESEWVLDEWDKLVRSGDLEAVQQVMLSSYKFGLDEGRIDQFKQIAFERFAGSVGLAAINRNALTIALETERQAKLGEEKAEVAEAFENGRKIYRMLCYTCHGENGEGTAMGADGLLAPAFINSERIKGDVASLSRILIHGMDGPIDGARFGAGMMAAMGSNGDQWVADVLTYVRREFGEQKGMVSVDQIAAVKEMEAGRSLPWNQDELESTFSTELDRKSDWKVSTSEGGEDVGALIVDDSLFWESKEAQREGLWIQVELPQLARISQMILDSSGERGRFRSKHFAAEVSVDGVEWIQVGDHANNKRFVRTEALGVVAKYVRWRIVAANPTRDWRVDELSIMGSYVD